MDEKKPIIPYFELGDAFTLSAMNRIVNAINNQLELLPWKCPYCEGMNDGKKLECLGCRAPRPGLT